MTGTVKWFDPRKGYGFIAGSDEKDVFVHYSAIQPEHEGDFRTLRTGTSVEYDVSTDANGRDLAVNVKAV